MKLDLVPPHSAEAERAVLGGIMVDNRQLVHAQEILQAQDFFSEPNRRIFRVMAALRERESAIDPVTVKEELSRGGEMDAIGGYTYIASLIDGISFSTNVGHYAQIVKELSEKRRKVEEAVRTLEDVLPGSAEDDDIALLLREVGLDDPGGNASLARVETALQELQQRLKGATPLRRALVRAGAVRALAKASIGAPAAIVDAAFEGKDEGEAKDLQGQPLILSDPEPWPDPVDGGQLLNDLQAAYTRFLVLPRGGTVAFALWTVHAHVHDAATTSPNIVAASPTKRAGKTIALTIQGALVPRPLPTSNISPAALFRAVEKFRPTLLVDEADAFLSLSEEMRGILNSGHTPATASVIRTVGDDHEPRCFSTWCPKAIALIGKLPPTVEDRSIIVPMRRKSPKEKVERLRIDRLHEFHPLRRRVARWALDNLEALRQADPEVPESLNDRAQDNWRPLLAIADRCGGAWPDDARWASRVLGGAYEEADNTPGIQMLADLREIFESRGTDRLPSKDVIAALVAREDRSWPEWRRGQPISEIGVAKLLKPFGIGPKGIRMKDGTTPRGYLRADLEDCFSRYLPSEVPQPQQASEVNNLSANARCNTVLPVAPREPVEKPPPLSVVAGVAPPQPQSAERSASSGEPISTDRERP
jgi:putative DNA primase/helicase